MCGIPEEDNKLMESRERRSILRRVAKSIVFSHLYEARFDGLIDANIHRLLPNERSVLTSEVDRLVKEILTQFILNNDFPNPIG